MNTEQLVKRLELWRRILMFACGLTLTLLALAITSVPSYHLSDNWGWYLVWFVAQVATAPLGFVLLVSTRWRELPLAERLNTIFGFFAVSWLLFFTFLIKYNRDEPYSFGGLLNLVIYALVLGAAIVLGLTYWWLRKSRINSPEQLFP